MTARIPTYCRCHTCGKDYDSLGIMRHRAAHRDRGQNCIITYSTGITKRHEFRQDKRVT